jgi:hypothetical protein
MVDEGGVRERGEKILCTKEKLCLFFEMKLFFAMRCAVEQPTFFSTPLPPHPC